MDESPTTKMLVRLPVAMKDWLRREAQRNLSSQTSEIVRAVRLRIESEQREKAAG